MKRSFLLDPRRRGGLAVVPWLGLPAFYESILYLVLHWVALATSWNLLSGYSGYFSFGHGAFFGIGMYTTATLATRLDIPFLWTLPAAAPWWRRCSARCWARWRSGCRRCAPSCSRCSRWPPPSWWRPSS
jgi:hypothetical protein